MTHWLVKPYPSCSLIIKTMSFSRFKRTIGVQLVDVDTGELRFHKVRDVMLDNDKDLESLRLSLDAFIRMLRDKPEMCIEFRGYKSHEQLELPF